MGTLAKYGNGTYLARWCVHAPDGTLRRISKSTGTSDIAQARAFLENATRELNLDREEKMLDAIEAARTGIAVRRGKIAQEKENAPALLIGDAFEAYRNSPERPDAGERTLSGYEAQFATFERWIGEHHPDIRELRHVDRPIADEFARYLSPSHSPNTYNKYLTFFSCLWRVLTEDAKLVSNPWSRMKKKHLVMHTRRELTVEELHRLTASLTGEMRLLFALGIYTGMRLGDCCTLNWGNVDIEKRIISVTPRKTAVTSGKRTLIPIHPTLGRLLDEIPEDNRTGAVLPELCLRYETEPATVTGRVRKVFEAADIKTSIDMGDGTRKRPDATFHSLRHTFVSLCANASVPLAVVQALVAHSNPAMTQHYFHEDPNALVNAVATIPNVIDV